ncbi:MAG: DEAD/DEAH box helicase [Jatrophihabitans sp.]
MSHQPVARSPADRYRAAKHRSAHPELAKFRMGYPFALDDFQVRGIESLDAGNSVLVCAPTGAGKTVVGEYAVHSALAVGTKCFYTTPIKALSNQKFRDLGEKFGVPNVGLLTGDVSINASAPVVVMTTEVLRNMLYVGSASLTGLGFVVMDEVHYLGDRFRGAVWEEVIIHLPESVQLASLSATVSNAEEFGEWLATVRGTTDVIVHEERPVPLWQHLLVGNQLYDLFSDAQQTTVDPQLLRAVSERTRRLAPVGYGRGRGRASGAGPMRGFRPTAYPDVLARLDREALLPCIVFIFSRAGCEAAVRQCVQSGMWLTGEDQREEIRRIAEERTSDLASEDLGVLGYWDWLDGLQRGIAAHHAGLVPAFKETVEELFTAGLVKAVFATETLALGINMPARSVVLDRLRKFNGDTHADITAGEYTQLTGRAGRRGIDIEGHAVVLWGPQVDPRQVAGLAATRTYPLRSSFRPSYNMAVNLVGQLGRQSAREVLETSFAQFQADRSVVGLARQLRVLEQTAERDTNASTCERGDIEQYAALRQQLSELEAAAARSGRAAARASAEAALESLNVGDVIRVPNGRRAGLAVVLATSRAGSGDTRPLVLTEDRWAGRVSLADFPTTVDVLAQLKVSKHFNHRSPQARRDLAAALRALNLPRPARSKRAADTSAERQISELRSTLRAHPCHGCPDREQHMRGMQRAARVSRELATMRHRVSARTDSLARTFDRVCKLLDEFGYLDGDARTARGEQLARIWGETDLLTAQCIEAGVLDGLAPAELAAAASALVYESRRDDQPVATPPGGAVAEAIATVARQWAALTAAEAEHGLPRTRAPDPGLAGGLLAWAQGQPLARALQSQPAGEELSAGDFVRWCRQVIDVLEQIARAVEPADLARRARAAADACRRGVVLA